MNPYEQALEAVRNLHADTTVTSEQTIASLEELRDETNDLINTLKEEMDQWGCLDG